MFKILSSSFNSSNDAENKLYWESALSTSCRWLIFWTFRMICYAFTPTSLLNLQHQTKRHHRLPIKPSCVLLACPHILSHTHYQWGCSRKCCLITSYTDFYTLWIFWSILSLSVCLNPDVQDHWEFSPRVDVCFQHDPDLTVCVVLAKITSNLLFTWQYKSNFCFVPV